MAFTANQREFNRGRRKRYTLEMNTESTGISPENTSGELDENALILFDLLDPKHAENKTLHNLRNILTRIEDISHILIWGKEANEIKLRITWPKNP